LRVEADNPLALHLQPLRDKKSGGSTKFCVTKTYHLAIYGNGFSQTWVLINENAREAPKVVGAVFPNFPVGRVGLLLILAQNLFNFRDCALQGISTHSYRTFGRKNP
jgi:hypothetical protein